MGVRPRTARSSAVTFGGIFCDVLLDAVAPFLLNRGGTEESHMETSERVPGHVLVVDDDEGVRKVLTRWVADMEYPVKAASDADMALEILGESPIEVALVDVRMPGHDGIWLMNQIQRHHPAVAIVLATGLLEMDPMITLRPGVVGYIVKPFNRDDLEKVVKRGMVEHKRLLAERRHAAPKMLGPGVVEGVVVSRS
jgi:DNA-binding NtrC family response regulator